MALAPPVISQDFRWRPKEHGPAQGAISCIAVEEHRRLPNAVTPKTLTKLAINSQSRFALQFSGLHDQVPAVRHQPLDLLEHPPGEFRISGGERHNDRFRIFPQQPEEESLQRGFHSEGHSVKFDRCYDARRVQLGVRLRGVMNNYLSWILLRTASQRLFASAAERDL